MKRLALLLVLASSPAQAECMMYGLVVKVATPSSTTMPVDDAGRMSAISAAFKVSSKPPPAP